MLNVVVVKIIILCISLVKLYYTNDSPVHRSHGQFTCYPMYWISSKQSDPHIQTLCTLSGARTVFFNFNTLRYTLLRCIETVLC